MFFTEDTQKSKDINKGPYSIQVDFRPGMPEWLWFYVDRNGNPKHINELLTDAKDHIYFLNIQTAGKNLYIKIAADSKKYFNMRAQDNYSHFQLCAKNALDLIKSPKNAFESTAEPEKPDEKQEVERSGLR